MILQSAIPYDTTARALPGVQPLDPHAWLFTDDAYAGQMAERARLLAGRREAVLWCDPAARPAAAELLQTVLAPLPTGFARDDDAVLTPDGRRVIPDHAAPFDTLDALVQEDFCLLTKAGEEHVLSAALLCFPAGWTLAQKAGRPLFAIHGPVDVYDGMMARRVQRLFDGVRAGRPLWRFNLLAYDDPTLYAPRREGDPPRRVSPDAGFWRSERQSILRLPDTGAVVFSIHTTVTRRGQ